MILKKLRTIHLSIFYLLIILLPLNLGKHFYFDWSYVNGLLIDYHIPTIFVQDILILVLLFVWVVDLVANKAYKAYKFNFKYFALIILFNFCVALSVLSSKYLEPSLYVFCRQLLYSGFLFYVWCNITFSKDFIKIINLISISMVFVSVLGILQWYKQSSVFNNYLFFGEQPYSYSTRGVVVENFFGQGKVASYGLFRHPNVFAGFLSVWILWCLYAFSHTKKRLYLYFICFAVLSMFCTLSHYVIFVLLILSVLFLLSLLHKKVFYTFPSSIVKTVSIVNIYLISVFIFLVFLISNLLLPYTNVSSNASIVRRSNFLTASYSMFKVNPLFGVGSGNNVTYIERFLPYSMELRFIQPVHNIFLLILTENGLFALGFFLILLFCVFWQLYKSSNSILFLSLFLFILLGLFDHYVITIHQTYLLFLLTLGICMAYNSER